MSKITAGGMAGLARRLQTPPRDAMLAIRGPAANDNMGGMK